MEHYRPSYILFDVGNVLVHIEPAAFLRSLGIDSPANRSYYQLKIIDIVKRYERGDDSTEMFFSNLDALFNQKGVEGQHSHGGSGSFSIDDLRTAMLSIVGSPVAGMEEIVIRVGRTVPLGLLSNTNPVHFDYCLKTFTVLQHIPTHFLSYEMHAFKPEAEIFERVTNLIGLPPGEILYIDDIAENSDAARAAGLNSHQFVGVKEFDRLLSGYGLLRG